MVFSKIKSVFGGNIKRMIIGSAPVKAEILDFFKITLGTNVTEGYGMTETTASFSTTNFKDRMSGHIGYIHNSMATRLKEHPDLG